jgi:glycosyltransferase involved in cell wall biosynthesis
MQLPRVSVVVPNYNHARYLRERMRSVLEQTYGDLEVIYLDDGSTDESDTVFREFAGDPRVRAERQPENSGRPFRQWNRGVALARGEYVWIAESDDSADRHFLEELVPVLDRNPSVGFAHCQFRRLGEQGDSADVAHLWWRDLHPSRWSSDFVSSGREELAYLGRWNTVSNASGVVFRRSVYERVGGADEDMQLAGDWLLWIKMALVSDVGFVARPLNQWRWHAATARARAARSDVERREVTHVLRFYAAETGIPAALVESRYHVHKAWAAVRAGRTGVALEHIGIALRRRPLGLEAWRLLLRVLGTGIARALGTRRSRAAGSAEATDGPPVRSTP